MATVKDTSKTAKINFITSRAMNIIWTVAITVIIRRQFLYINNNNNMLAAWHSHLATQGSRHTATVCYSRQRTRSTASRFIVEPALKLYNTEWQTGPPDFRSPISSFSQRHTIQLSENLTSKFDDQTQQLLEMIIVKCICKWQMRLQEHI